MLASHSISMLGTAASSGASRRGARRHWIINVAHIERRAGTPRRQTHRFVKLRAVVGQFKCAAHFSAARALLVRNKTWPVPMRSNFLIAVILRIGFLQFAAVGEERALAILLVGEIDFRILRIFLRKGQGIRRRDRFLNALAVLVALSASPAAMAANGKAADAYAAAASGSASAARSRVVHFLPRIVAVVAVQLPLAQYGCPRLRARLLA